MKRQLRTLFYTVVWWPVLSCTGNEEPEIITHIHNATIKATVIQEIFTGNDVKELAVSGAYVVLFETVEDRQQNQHAVVGTYTDAEGLAVFSNLDQSYYYLACSHPAFGNEEEEVSTPDGTVSFVTLIY